MTRWLSWIPVCEYLVIVLVSCKNIQSPCEAARAESREHMSTTFLVSRALHLHRAQPSWCQHRVCTTCLTRGKIKSDWFVIWFKWSTEIEHKLTRDIWDITTTDYYAPFLTKMDVVFSASVRPWRPSACQSWLRVKINKHIVCRNIAASLQRVTL